MAGFLDVSFKNTSNQLIQGYRDRLKNPYYKWSDKKWTMTTYYNTNITKSTLDEGSRTTYEYLGKDSSIKFNVINDCVLYGLERIQVNLDNGEFGLEGNEITGTAITLPNTFIPYPGDFFIINHIDHKYLFKVNTVTPDTLENGDNFYQLEYKLDQIDPKAIEPNVENSFVMAIDNVGTNFKSVIRTEDYDFVKVLSDISMRLKSYYKGLFYNERVESFILVDNGSNFYDAYLTEFIIKNKLMDKCDKFLYISHQVALPDDFIVWYDKTVFRATELCKKDKFTYIRSKAYEISDRLCIMAYRPEVYYKIDYFNDVTFANTIFNFTTDFVDRLTNGRLYHLPTDLYKNIIIKYFNNSEMINPEDIKGIDEIDFTNNIEQFYLVPILIFVVEYYIKKMLKNI